MNSAAPKVSVYNGERYLPFCVTTVKFPSASFTIASTDSFSRV